MVAEELPEICAFPIYTRSGEILVNLTHLKSNLNLSDEELRKVTVFHNFTFSDVLRLEKYPMVFDPKKSDNQIFILPLTKNEGGEKIIDWKFVENIVLQQKQTKLDTLTDEDRKGFSFRKEDYNSIIIH